MDELKRIVADNIFNLRTAHHMTQYELGEKLNYSDKAVSKWERGDAIPDAYVLKKMGELFHVTVDYLVNEHPHDQKAPLPLSHTYSHTAIMLISVIGIWTLSLLAFIICWLCGRIWWLIFAYTLPVSLIVMLVMNSLWGKPRRNLYIISGLIWSVLAAVYFSFFHQNWWPLFLLGLPAELLVCLGFRVRKKHL